MNGRHLRPQPSAGRRAIMAEHKSQFALIDQTFVVSRAELGGGRLAAIYPASARGIRRVLRAAAGQLEWPGKSGLAGQLWGENGPAQRASVAG